MAFPWDMHAMPPSYHARPRSQAARKGPATADSDAYGARRATGAAPRRSGPSGAGVGVGQAERKRSLATQT
eukprot:CAMPEP_0198492162 /NCGR_PEP_ID=MMETSP1462-20131121/3274_1 /TAXON_ID=1333877 /ORGANISM="Brandtodinium nutriculum, Strain RCC3387" /LENGTH=70 /DNA_ID=CAMNT_0044220797 /DNA_START=120 /DNA_END=328 /DNA_ORIENTATION=+